MDQASFRKMKSIFEPKQTPDELDRFIRDWLKIELPWDTVDEDSTSSPLKAVWGVYKVMLTNQGPTRHVIAASRNTAKTVDASLIQFLSLLHMRRDGAHIAAIIDQSLTAIRYLDSYMGIPELAQYRKTDNVRVKRFINLPPNDLTPRPEATLRVVTATKKGANSPRASCLTLDEVDLTPQEILSEVAFVADPERHNKFSPVFVYLSSRKTNDGPIQKLMEQAESTKNKGRTKLHKWSHADFMEKCLPEIHKPELGKHSAYLHTERLDVIWGDDEFNVLPDAAKAMYRTVSAFEGCKTCTAFVACQGRSAKQRGSSHMLRTREFVGDILENVGDPAVIIAQSLNWKPESTALVFKTFSIRRHVSGPTQFYEWAVGSRFNPQRLSEDELDHLEEEGTSAQLASITPSKIDIYKAMKASGWDIVYGVDWGYSPDPGLVIVVGYHKKTRRTAVLHTDWRLEHANHVWAGWVAENVYPHMPCDWVAPDMADKSSPTYFVPYGISVYSEAKQRIETGVSFIRGLLWNPVTQQSSFMILDDSADYMETQVIGKEKGNMYTINCMSKWTHHKSATGTWDMTKFADNQYTHPIDALRYALAPFIEESKTSASFGQSSSYDDIQSKIVSLDPAESQEARRLFEQKNEMRQQVADYYQDNFGLTVRPGSETVVPGSPSKPKGRAKIRF